MDLPQTRTTLFCDTLLLPPQPFFRLPPISRPNVCHDDAASPAPPSELCVSRGLGWSLVSAFQMVGEIRGPRVGSRVDERLLVLQPGIRAVPLRWESQLQDTGPQETSQLHVIPNGKNLSEISISTSRPSFTQRPASYSAGHPMPNN